MLKGVANPVFDESFSSWAYRVAITQSADEPAFITDLIEAYTRAVQSQKFDYLREHGAFFKDDLPYLDLDYDKTCHLDIGGFVFDRYAIPPSLFRSSSLIITSWYDRALFCPECMNSDIATRGFPSWRNTWNFGTTAICSTHTRPLLTLRNGCDSYSRSWEAFKQGVPQECLMEDTTSSRHDARLRDLLAKRVQLWRQNLLRTGAQRVWSGVTLPISEIAQIFDLTYSLLLKKRTIFSAGGMARTLLVKGIERPERIRLSIHDAMRLGVNESNAHQRASALILCGVIFGIIKNYEAKSLADSTRKHGILWPVDPYRIGVTARAFATREEYFALREKYARFPLPLLERLAAFLEGIEHGVHAFKDQYSADDSRWYRSGHPFRRWMLDPRTENVGPSFTTR